MSPSSTSTFAIRTSLYPRLPGTRHVPEGQSLCTFARKVRELPFQIDYVVPITPFPLSVKTGRVARLTLVLHKDSKPPPSLEFGFLVLVTALFAVQPEDEPIDIPLLRGQSFPGLHEQVRPVRQEDQFDWFFLFRQPSVPFPGGQVGKVPVSLDAYRSLDSLYVESRCAVEPRRQVLARRFAAVDQVAVW